MHLIRAELAKGVSLVLGGVHHPLHVFAPAVTKVAYGETPDGDLHVQRPDGKIIIIPCESIAQWDRRETALPGPVLPMPDVADWDVESVYFRVAVQLDHLGIVESWRREADIRGGAGKLGDITSCEIRNRTVWLRKPAGDLAQIPYRSVATILLRPPAKAKPIPIEIHDEWPDAERTTAAPPRRAPRRA
jgi:hypothetical protein